MPLTITIECKRYVLKVNMFFIILYLMHNKIDVSLQVKNLTQDGFFQIINEIRKAHFLLMSNAIFQ